MAYKYKNHPIRHITDLRDMLRTSTQMFGNAVLFKEKVDGTWQNHSFNQYYADVNALGAALCKEGYCDKRIIVTGENCYMWTVAYMAVICGVGTIVPVDKEIPAEEIANIARVADVSLIFHSPKLTEKMQSIDSSVKLVSFDKMEELIAEGNQLLAEGNTFYFDRPIDPDAMSSLIFTSGTTGLSKGVMLSHSNICFNLEEMCQMIEITPKDTFLSVLPLHHAYECTCGFLCQVYRGCCIAFSEGLRYITKNMQEVHPTIMLCVPLLAETMYKKVWNGVRKQGIEDKVNKAIKLTNAIHPHAASVALKRKLFQDVHNAFGGSLKLLICGGAAVDPEVLKGLRDFGILAVQGYGLTECAPLAAVNRDTLYDDTSAGLSTPRGELEIVDVADDGTGEIRYRGKNIMIGYFNMPEITKQTLSDGWFYTGDLGYIDDRGFLHITGRKKNVIVTYNGKNIFPEELEAYLCRTPYVAEAVVVGIMNNKKKDYDIVALIYPNYERIKETFGPEYTTKQLQNAIKDAVREANNMVQAYKRMEDFILWPEEFPKNSSKKIKRQGLLEQATAIYFNNH